MIRARGHTAEIAGLVAAIHEQCQRNSQKKAERDYLSGFWMHEFLALIPVDVPLPALSLDMDGEWTADWRKDASNYLVVVATGDGALYFSGMYDGEDFGGFHVFADPFSETPPWLSEDLLRVLSHFREPEEAACIVR